MGLGPKPTSQGPLRTWEDLDRELQSQFKLAKKSGNHFTWIDPDVYEMSEQEIFDEGERQGYKVTRHENGQLRFE